MEILQGPGLLAWSLTKYGVLLDRCGLWLDEQSAAASVEFADFFLKLYLQMSHAALESKQPLYRMRPKYHAFCCEIVNRTRFGNKINPRFVGCATEEDLIGKVCGALKGAIHPSTLGKRILERMLLGVNIHVMKLREGKTDTDIAVPIKCTSWGCCGC